MSNFSPVWWYKQDPGNCLMEIAKDDSKKTSGSKEQGRTIKTYRLHQPSPVVSWTAIEGSPLISLCMCFDPERRGECGHPMGSHFQVSWSWGDPPGEHRGSLFSQFWDDLDATNAWMPAVQYGDLGDLQRSWSYFTLTMSTYHTHIHKNMPLPQQTLRWDGGSGIFFLGACVSGN